MGPVLTPKFVLVYKTTESGIYTGDWKAGQNLAQTECIWGKVAELGLDPPPVSGMRNKPVPMQAHWWWKKKNACQCMWLKRCGFSPWMGKIPWRRAWQPTPGFLPGESHGQRNLASYSPCRPKELDTDEWLTLSQSKWMHEDFSFDLELLTVSCLPLHTSLTPSPLIVPIACPLLLWSGE